MTLEKTILYLKIVTKLMKVIIKELATIADI